jgi:hypothetical protein
MTMQLILLVVRSLRSIARGEHASRVESEFIGPSLSNSRSPDRTIRGDNTVQMVAL